MEQFDVVVVGAGWYGLIAARTYLELVPGTRLLIVDDSLSIGGAWSRERVYPNLYAQISHPLFEYSFYPMKKEGISGDGFISGATIHKYLANFAKDHDLVPRVRLETRVNQVKRNSNGCGWVLETSGGQLECNKLIYATGANSSPIIPSWPRSRFEKPVIHTWQIGQYLGHIEEYVQRASVVGASKSAYDMVFHLLNAGKKVDWIIRDGPSGPFSIYAPTFMGLWNIVDHISTRMAANFSPSIMNTSGFWYYFLQRTIAGRGIINVYWRIATYLSARHADYSKSEHTQGLRAQPKQDGLFWGSGGIGIATVPNFWKVMHAGDVTIHRSEIESLSHKDVVNLKNGYSVPADIVILCTGFNKGYDTFSKELQQELELLYDNDKPSRWATLDAQGEEIVNRLLPYLRRDPLASNTTSRKRDQGPNRHYRRLVVPQLAAQGDRTILFPGHIHSAFTPLAAELQALWGVAFLEGWLELPSQKEMELEAATFNAWTRKRYLEQGRKHSYFIYDFLSYIDTLMRDLGLNPHRKSNMFAEMFVPYKPRDYRGLIDEYLAARAKAGRAS
ncbi:Flavin-binding monooxygenase-like family protein [Coccidioides posadasii C735 delta SOWgp]|uniref:Flavin-binding monooxygenase-like family protein n=1 Tax=Coccidioides posadasii (strain C735) TaxID=222929 RepID=C5P379_COCP7|nr:Flavin-binding monooxygenase-like family protein [Coccidioides posadasii C735 delta SOWgp]EER28767.1 Flavin-binding monooxygenase-like family protein [Coccidioides posadasii C735 delta SOWgp]|eukprot:XP_003070912.1 Flavin-binding monooxygenase-like family protein [Coccidioides posadasii C735 delta SOWgp]